MKYDQSLKSSSNHRWISLRHTELNDAEHDLDALLCRLYDDMDSKVETSQKISLLSLDIDRLGAMASHKSALGALARVLREEGRKNFHLRSNAISTFWIFSHFKNFHQLLIENQIGRATLLLLELEYMRTQNLPGFSTRFKVQTGTDQVVDSNIVKDEKMLSLNSTENKPAWQEQERFLYMSICLLYHIAEDVQIEKRMRKYNLVEHLCEALNRANTFLLTILVPALVTCLLRCEPCIQVEVMEILNNLARFGELRDTLLTNASLLNYITAHLQVSNNEDDVNLQIIMLISGVYSLASASIISKVGLVENLCNFFLDRHDDVDIALQCLYAIHCFLSYEPTCNAFFQQFEKIMHQIVALSQDCEKSIVAMADLVIDTICNLDQSRGHAIRSLRFNMNNAGW